MKYFFLILFLATSVAASHDYFFYNNENDFRHNRDVALYDPYDAYDVDDFNDFDDYECFSLDDYNYYASRDPYDNWDPLTARNIGNSEFKDLRYADQLQIINENSGDKWDENDVENLDDMECWTLKDYNNYASEKPSDKWDEVHFHDFDDLETVNEVGIRRYGFIEPDDLAEFDLQYTSPHYDDYYYDYR